MKTLIVMLFMTGLLALAFAQSARAPAHVTPADAKNHIGETAVVCGKVVDAKVPGMESRATESR